jgi:hypothetical protein
MRLFAAVATFLTAITGTALAEQPCDLRGAWELVSSTLNTVPGPSTVTSRKIFSKTRFAVIANDIRYSGPLLGPHEVLSFYNSLVAVGGTYDVTGTTWTEKIDSGTAGEYLGLSLTFSCQQAGDRLIQKGTLPIFSGGKKVSDLPLEELWRRLDRP